MYERAVYELIAYCRLGEVLAADDRGRNANAEGAGGQCRLVVGLVRENDLLVTWRWWLDGMPAVVVLVGRRLDLVGEVQLGTARIIEEEVHAACHAPAGGGMVVLALRRRRDVVALRIRAAQGFVCAGGMADRCCCQTRA